MYILVCRVSWTVSKHITNFDIGPMYRRAEIFVLFSTPPRRRRRRRPAKSVPLPFGQLLRYKSDTVAVLKAT